MGAVAVLALPLTGLAVLNATPPASADAVMGPVTDLGEHDVDVNGAPTMEFFWNASLGTRFLFMTGVVPGSASGRELTAVDLSSGRYAGDWPLPQGTQPNDSLVADGDTVWASSAALSQDTQLFKVGSADPIADFQDTEAVAVADGRAYLFHGASETPQVTVLDDEPSSPGYLQPIATTPPPALYDLTALTSGGDRLFAEDGNSVVALDADPASPAYLTKTGAAPAPSGNPWLAADTSGHRLLSWDGGGAISVYSADGGQLVADGTIDPCTSMCHGISAAVSPDGRRAYVITGDVPDEVRVYDMTTPSHPQVAAIESFAGAGSGALGLSPDGTELTTGGKYPKIARVEGFASIPKVDAPVVSLPGDSLTVELGDWSSTPTWQWLRNGAPISGTVDATTYRVARADLGARLTVRAVVEGLGTRTSAPVAVAHPPRISVSVSGQRRGGWYRGQARVRFTCTAGTGKIAHCPPASTLHAGTNQRVSGTATDQYGLTAIIVRSGIDVCDRCVTGAGYASGRWVVRPRRRYTVAIVGGSRPLSVGLARPRHSPVLRPVATHRGDAVGDRTVWLFTITAPRGRGHWSLSYRAGPRTARIPLTVH